MNKYVVYGLIVFFITVTVYFAMFPLRLDPQLQDFPLESDSSVTMSFVSGTEYKPNQVGQVIVEARYVQNGTTAIQSSICYQGPFNVSSSCGGIASTGFSQGDFVLSGGANDAFFAKEDALFNYTKPSGAVYDGSKLTVKYGNSTLSDAVTNNFTIPFDCWSENPYNVQFAARIISSEGEAPFYYEANEVYCRNSTSWKRIYKAGEFALPSGDNPAATTLTVAEMFDGDFNTRNCYSVVGLYGIQIGGVYYFGSYSCRAGGSGQYESASSIFEFAMSWNMSTNCIASVWYPDKTSFIDHVPMNISDSNGNAYIEFIVPNIDGVYEYQSTCNINGKFITASKSFHVTKQRIRAVIPK